MTIRNNKMKELTLKYNVPEFEIMKAKKETFIKNHKFKSLDWNDFVKILVFDSK